MLHGLPAEIKQPTLFSSPEEEAYIALLRTTDALLRTEVELLKRFGLSPSQYNALRILRAAGDEGATCGELGERLLTKDPDITRLIDRLEKRELSRRTRSDLDRRVVRSRITPSGLDLLAQIDGPLHAWTKALLGHLGKDQLTHLVRLLELARERSTLNLQRPTPNKKV